MEPRSLKAMCIAAVLVATATQSALAWKINSGSDQKSGRPYDIAQQWSKAGDALIGLECQGGFESGLLGVAIISGNSSIKPKNKRIVDFKIGSASPLKISMILEQHPDFQNYTLNTSKGQVNADLFNKLVNKLETADGDITVTFDTGSTFIFPDEQRKKVIKRWLQACGE